MIPLRYERERLESLLTEYSETYTLKAQDVLLISMKVQTRKFTAILDSAEEGGYVVKCLELPVATEGETKDEAIRNLKEAIEGYLRVRTELLGKSMTKKRLVEITVKQASGPIVA